jgi:excisionase family DNA binding protein
MKTITHNNLPEAVAFLLEEVRSLKEMLSSREPATASTRPVSTKELCAYLGVSVPTVIRWRKKEVIPFFTIGSAVRFDVTKVVKALEDQKLI